ncbi:MAG: 50S ribosomal protein L6 [Patescibacteria group bacterium]|nr:MAG: 50S ribosomal protein L6 [Patescibacteria group bacterium]
MSRLGKLPIELPTGVSASYSDSLVTVKGPKGELKQLIGGMVSVVIDEKVIKVSVANKDNRKERAMWGLYYSLIKNMVIGVSEGFSKKLEIQGVGYKVSGGGKALTLNLGFSHPINFSLPEGTEATVEGNSITISGIDKQLVGEISAQIRKLKKPEPYKGKGIRYSDEIVRRKAGKTATKGS